MSQLIERVFDGYQDYNERTEDTINANHIRNLPSHSRAFVINALDNNLKMRQLTVMIDERDGWFGYEQGFNQVEKLHAYVTHVLCNQDHTILGYKSNGYTLQDGIYKRTIDWKPQKC